MADDITDDDLTTDHSGLAKRCALPHFSLVLLSIAILSVGYRHPEVTKMAMARDELLRGLPRDCGSIRKDDPATLLERSGFPNFSQYAYGSNPPRGDFAIDTSDLLHFLQERVENVHFERTSSCLLRDIRRRSELVCATNISYVDPGYLRYSLANSGPAGKGMFSPDSAYDELIAHVFRDRDNIESIKFGRPSSKLPFEETGTRDVIGVALRTIPAQIRYKDKSTREVAFKCLFRGEACDLNFSLLDSIWSEIQVLTPVEAVKELNERLHRDSDFVTLLSFSVPKSLVAIGCLFGIYLALFDLAAWITWDLSQNRKAVNAAEVTWTLLLPTASGLLAVVATLFVLPVVSSCFGMAVFYKTTLSASAVIASFMVSGISGLAMICVTAMSKVRGDEPLVRKCLGLSVLVIFLLLQCQPSVYSAMYVVSTVNREIPSGWGATFLAGALPVLPLATAAQFSLLAMCLLGSGVRLADDTPFVPLDRLGDVVKRKGVLISAGVAIVLLYILPYVMENLPDHWVSPWVSRVAALVESAAVVFAISQGFVATAVSILLCVFIWKRYVQKLV